jgi:Mce-associated membrane protein
MTTTDSPPEKAVRRRAVRAAGPAKDGAAAETTTVRVDKAAEQAPKARKAGSLPRRPAHRVLVAIAALSVVGIAAAATGAAAAVMFFQKKDQERVEAHSQRFVDTAQQTLVNMYTFKPDTVDQSIDQFYGQISGNLRDEWARDNHIANLKSLLRATGNSSEAIVNGAAMESFDDVNNDATVLVSLRVTQSDKNGNNQPSTPMRWRLVVHQDFDTGNLTTVDMKYPDGGN